MKTTSYRILWKGQITRPFGRDEIEEMLSKNEILSMRMPEEANTAKCIILKDELNHDGGLPEMAKQWTRIVMCKTRFSGKYHHMKESNLLLFMKAVLAKHSFVLNPD